MMKKSALVFTLLASFFVFTIGCEKTEKIGSEFLTPNLEGQNHEYSIEEAENLQVSSHWGGSSLPNLNSSQNPLTNEGATLGRVLFYDGRLSVNDLISCGSCHQQAFGFADPSPSSHGFGLKQTSRNSMSLSNMGMMRRYFWDLRATNLEEQVMMPIQNHIEMGIEKLEDLPPKLTSTFYYPALFEAAFGSPEITEQRISFALAQFLRSMVSLNAKFDAGLDSDFANFNAKEKLGLELFRGKAQCESCHEFPLVGGRGTANIGLDVEYEDQGLEAGHFKIPSLRNISRTAPYMHDGRFGSLMDVVEHYSNGLQPNPFLDWRLRGEPLNLNPVEKDALVAFLQTLTDEEYLTDPKFSDPF